jgi:hypothetical protein
MSGGLADEPLARAVLRHLADTRGKDDPMGSLARTVLSGEAGLREAANDPWHAQGMAAAFAKSQRDLSADERARYEREARRLAGLEDEHR